MSILNLKHPGTKLALRHEVLQGKQMIGRGWFAAVFDNGDTVLKLTCDNVQYGFYTDYFRPQGEHFPKLVENYGHVGEQYEHALFLVEMEKLTPVGKKASCPEAWVQRKTILEVIESLRVKHCDDMPQKINPVDYHCRLTEIVLTAASEDDRLTPAMRSVLEQIGSYVSNYHGAMDFKPGNFMLRGDTLVFNDVIVDIETICSRNSRRQIFAH